MDKEYFKKFTYPGLPSNVGDYIYVLIYNTGPATQLNIYTTQLTKDFKISQGYSSLQISENSLFQDHAIPITEGYIYHIMAEISGVELQPGDCMVKLLHYQGEPPNGQLLSVLTQGMIYFRHTISWPSIEPDSIQRIQKALYIITMPNPTIGTNFDFTNQNSLRYTIHSIAYDLVTSGAVADRYPQIIIADTTQDAFTISSTISLGASLNRRYQFIAGYPTSNDIGTTRTFPFPPNVELHDSWHVKSGVYSMDATDRIQNIKIYLKRFFS